MDFISILASEGIDWDTVRAEFRNWVRAELGNLNVTEDLFDTLKDIIQMDHSLAHTAPRQAMKDVHYASGYWTGGELFSFIEWCLED
jgi:hypothetical protein